MDVKIESDGDKWFVTVDGGETVEFRDRVYALIHLNNLTAAMVYEEE